MTSNTTPSGRAYCLPASVNNDAYKLFDGVTYLTSGLGITGGNLVGYEFDKPTVIKMVGFASSGTSTADSYFIAFTITVRGINNGASTTIKTINVTPDGYHKGAFRNFIYFPIDNDVAYKAYELDITTNYRYQWNTVVGGIQLWGLE